MNRTDRTVEGMKRPPRPASTGAEKAREQLPAILDAAAAGRSTIITRRGRAIAAIVPVDQARTRQAGSLLSLAGSGKGLWGTSSSKAISKLRDEWNR
jgi:antitoxin (DNA-binding transcriptional repressor) of toxin-antitoxin stability system